MTKIKTVIVEDETPSLFFLKEELNRYKNLEIIAEYQNGLEGLRGINELKPDLVFVDIEMPVMDGFKMLQRLQHEPVIIFCTGYKKYACEAWDYNASDFITKPVEPSRVKKALEKALNDMKNRRQERLSEQRKLAGLENVTWINMYNERVSRFFAADEINFIQSDADYIKFFLVKEVLDELEINESFIAVKMTIKKAAEIWEKHDFRRAHRGYVVNRDKTILFNSSKMILRLKDVDKDIPVGRKYLDNFKNI